MIWQSLQNLNLLWLLPLAVLLFCYAGWRRRRALERFASSGLLPRLVATVSLAKRRWKAALTILALAFLIVALARPCWNPIPQTITRKGRDVVFVLDVSRSMLADDLQPNRLERAKLAIQDCLEALQGDRVALVIFAGTALVRCPLTLDYSFFNMMLADVEPRSVGRGGTRIGDALRKVMAEVFDDQERQFKDVILITDGEDQDSFPKEAAQALGKAGVRLLAVGLGDEKGTPILVANETGVKDFIKDGGEVVRSKLDGATLRAMAAATPGGRYLPVATGNFDLGAVYRSLIATAERRSLESETIDRYEEKYQIFVALALALLLLESLLSERKATQALLLCGCLLMGDDLLRQGNQALREGKYDAASSAYAKALESHPDNGYLLFNRGVAAFRKGDFEQAREFFGKAGDRCAFLKHPDLGFESLARTATGDACFRQAKALPDEQLKQKEELVLHAIHAYGKALEIAPKDTVATANRAAARLELKRILGVKYMQAKERQKQQEMARKLQELADQQEKAADDTRKNGATPQQQEQQRQLSQKTEELTKDQQNQPLDEAKQHQQAAERALQENRPQDAEKEQREAAGKMREALQKQQQEQEQQQQEQSGQEEKKDQEKKDGGQEKKELPDQEQQNQEQQEQPAPSDNPRNDKEQPQNEDAKDILGQERQDRKERESQKARQGGYIIVPRDY